ncbi:hypothetical protein D917_02626 [Trichinella nativa]|uniref:Elongator complex protein 6 n=1 Tax=Trichinella nativa TaxID=6335 RepID=A0A1Y3ECQ3_9BILA|nr:hypothetical protein D917_02626 [Trichinella nativa]
MYTQLDDFLAFSPNCLPNGKVVVIQDDHTIDGSFLLYQFISMYYRAGAKILLVCTQNPSSHYETVLKKLHMPISESDHFTVIDTLKRLSELPMQPSDRNSAFMCSLRTEIEKILEQLQTIMQCENQSILIVIDCIFTLHALPVLHSSLVNFISKLSIFVDNRHCLVMKMVTDEMASRRIQDFSNFCINTASLIFQVLPLETGTGRNVHCKIDSSVLRLFEVVEAVNHLYIRCELRKSFVVHFIEVCNN